MDTSEVRSELLDQIPWLRHGFGTRHSSVVSLPLATVKQVHSTEVLRAGEVPGETGVGDAVVSITPGLAVGVRTADCVPLLLADREHRVVAAIHAGWRGTAGEIARLSLERMRAWYKTNPIHVAAAIGPAIGECCFEVGPEVAHEFSKWDSRMAGTSRKEHLDLQGLNAQQLYGGGVPAGSVEILRFCTKCGKERFHSYRRDHTAGRQMSWIAVEGPK